VSDSRQLAAGPETGPTEPSEAAPTPPAPVVRDDAGRFAPGSGRPRGRRPGAVAGNLNAAHYPWQTFWRRRALRPEDRWALVLVRDYVDDLVADKGGDANVSAAERHVMELAAVSRVCWALALTAKNMEAVARFVAQERAALDSIGLERRAKPAQSLDAYLAAKAASKGAK
jgi:hypothetical protein